MGNIKQNLQFNNSTLINATFICIFYNNRYVDSDRIDPKSKIIFDSK
jgi:hypothetical protein